MSLYSPGRRRAIILLILSSLLLITLDLRGNSILNSARSAWNQALRPFESAAEVVARPVRNAWRGITDYDDLQEENRRLRNERDAQQADTILARSLLARLGELEAAADLETVGDFPRVSASVVGLSPSNIDQTLEIDKGRNDGIRVGMPVISPSGFVVGKITEVTADRSVVRLLTDTNYWLHVKIVRPEDELPQPQFATTTTTTTTTTAPPPQTTPDGSLVEPTTTVPVVQPPPTAATTTSSTTTTTAAPEVTGDSSAPTTTIPAPPTTVVDPERETGLLTGRGPGEYPVIELVADTPAFGSPVPGDAVLTVGGSQGLAPPNLLVGVVASVDRRSPAEGLTIEVAPIVDINSLEFVEVILYQPESEADD
ncbi:rod shape-determining protein MreC [Desertimonas flava]|jgi:rod shape-determining protein MreC|uniref:rod shape-determining protein MreC n=1 Tax=Desertimonas flava TaxID=2064846 RepID=UPI000E340A54|nr:rod shape-determining protein MreC [Desertimonas flava]